MTAPRKVAFRRIAEAALLHADVLVQRWLPDGKREGCEWSARNPTRTDDRPGSFKTNLNTGAWSDFASGDRGGDLISLAAFLFGLKQAEAAVKIADMLGVSAYE